MSTISASTTTTTAFRITTDTAGTLVFQTGSTPTTAMTLGTNQSATFAGATSYTGLATFSKGSSNGITIGDVTTNSNSVLRLQGTSLGYNWQIANNLNVAGIEFTPSTATGGTTFTTPTMALTTTGLGIGNTSPSYPLDVVGNSGSNAINIRGRSADNIGTFRFTSNNAATSYATLQASASRLEIATVSTLPLIFSPNQTEAARIDSSGNFGLGVTPSAWASGWKALQLGGVPVVGSSTDFMLLINNAYYDGASYRRVATGFASRYVQSGGLHYWETAGSSTANSTFSFTQAMTLDASQNLSVTSGNTNAMIGFNALNDSFTPGGGATTPQYGIARGSAGSNTLGVSGYSGLAFYTSGVERGRFDSGGNFIMRGNNNYVAPSSGSANFRIEAANAAGQNAYLYLTCPGSNEGAFYYERATSRLYAYSQSGGVYLNPTGTSWVATSDERFKDIIEPIMNAAQRLKSWRTVFGKFKSDEEGTRRAFFIAQDLLVNTPEVVDAVEPEKLGVLYTETIPVVAAAVNEHTDELASLKAAIQELNTRLTALEAK